MSSSQSVTTTSDRQLINIIGYLASLVSDPHAIDSQLDTLRQVTARGSSDTLSAPDRAKLMQLQAYLENYLITSDPLRQFTQESVNQRIKLAFGAGRSFVAFRLPLLIIWAAAALMCLLPFVLPLPGSGVIRPVLSITGGLTALNVGAAILLWMSRRNFRMQLRAVYMPICLGFVIVSVSLIQVPIVLNIGTDVVLTWFRYVTASLPCLLGTMFIYIGIRRFCLLRGLARTYWLSLRRVIVVVLGAAIAVSLLLLPFGASPTIPTWMRLVSLLVLTSGTVLAAITILLTIRLRRTLGAAYQWPLIWLASIVLCLALTFVQYIVLRSITSGSTFFEARGMSTLSLLLMGLFALKAGIDFKRFDGR
ncbi:MAG TPA: hypothetical protein VLG11_02475 [Candidatus Saccharimonadales bacterium]|nr:hypothetical protein [Candidatus Saccharimonadales bacterium]